MQTLVSSDLMQVLLGHDQTASHCPWVQLTRSTSDYPSRKGQAALALLTGAVPATPEAADLMFRCDGCIGCQVPDAYNDLIYAARALLVRKGFVPFVDRAADNWRTFGNVYDDVRSIVSSLKSPASGSSQTRFVPGAASLFHQPDATTSAWTLLRGCSGEISIDEGLLDSGFILRELGLEMLFVKEASRIRDVVSQRSCSKVIVSSRKETCGFTRVLSGLPVVVTSALAEVVAGVMTGRFELSPVNDGHVFVLAPSEFLFREKQELEKVENMMSGWLGSAYQPLQEDGRYWPAAMERPSTDGNEKLAARLAIDWAEQMLARAADAKLTVLTVEPFSQMALNRTLAGRAKVEDCLSFIERHALGRVDHD